ncbi:MAG: YARHG domain-containing protein [Dichotomicrobium sp.]
MTIKRFGYIAAFLFAVSFAAGAWAQNGDDQTEADPGNGDQMEMTDDQGTDEPADPAAPESDSMDSGDMEESMSEDGDAQTSEPAGEAAEEETGPSDIFSDSSERALTEADLSELDCEELWIARNEIFNRNGYCFQSARGQEYFDNSDCTSDSQDILSQLEWDNVELIKAAEREQQCN